MNLILVRHAVTAWIEQGKKQGHHNVGLNEKGIEEAKQLAASVAHFPITKIVCSDLKRAWQTADIIAEVLAKKVVLDTRLRECSFGSLEGMTESEAVAKYGPSISRDWGPNYKDYDFKPFGGESRDDVLARHLECLNDLDNGRQDWICIVGHGRGLSTVLQHLKEDTKFPTGTYRQINFHAEKKVVA
jgi:probable phosphoglycerate mutase